MAHPSASRERANYGFDAPGVMAGLLGGRAAALAAGVAVATLAPGWWRWLGVVIAVAGALPFVLGFLMNVYYLVGKRRTRDHILDLAKLRGDETVLDVGTGAGLMLVGAAKRLPRGRAVGVDAWAAKDLSNNTARATERNIAAEGVVGRCEVVTGDARELAFPDASFDRVVSLLCLHNIEGDADQARACGEIARVLKPGGRLVIGDYVPTHGYAKAFAEAGLRIVQSRAALGVALSLMWIVVAEKPGAGK